MSNPRMDQNENDRRMSGVIGLGKVIEVNLDDYTARVQDGTLKTGWLRMGMMRAFGAQMTWPYVVGEEVGYPVGDNSWYVKAVFAPGVTEITVREMGFFDEDGDLIALWAGLGVGDNRNTGPHEYLINHVLDFRAVEVGLAIIDAPLDEYLDHAVIKLTTDAIQTDLLLKQAKKQRDLELAL